MKKILVVVLAVLLAVSTMPMTVFAASEPAKFDFAGFDVKKDSEGNGVVVDLENKIVYGLATALKVSDLGKYLEKGAEVDSMYVCEKYGTAAQRTLADSEYIGTGTYIVLEDEGVEYPFQFVVFGDVNGDSVCDALDAFYIAKVVNNVEAAPTDVATNMAATSPETYEEGITLQTYQNVVNNAVMKDEEIDQNKGDENANTVESIVIEDQVYTGEEITVDGDIEILFNDAVLADDHYEIVKYDRNIDQTTGKEKATVTLKGKGLFAGEIVVEFEIVGILQSIVNEVNKVIAEANLADVCQVVYTNNADVDNIDVVINASKAIRGDFNVNMEALNGLLTKIDEYRAENLPGLALTVDEFALASNGSFSRGDVKAFVFDLVRGAFCELAYAQSNTIKSYSGEISTTNVNGEKFNINLVVAEDYAGDINRIKAFSAKIARYVSFDVVNGNAVINVAMPAAFSAKVVDYLSDGDVDAAIAKFNGMRIIDAATYLSKVSVEDISAGSVKEIEQALTVAAMLVDFVNKGLGEVADATVTTVDGKVMPLLNGASFNIDTTNSNKFGALVKAAANLLSYEVLMSSVGEFAENGIYTVAADIALDYKGIKETVIVNLDLFTAAVETPTVIENTAKYFSGIIEDLGIANAVTVTYDKDDCRALATLDARELVTNFTLDPTAFDGLYTDIKGYFDDNYGTSTIVVDGNEIVKAGKINKSALKTLIFSAATGFFQDAANLGANNVLRSMDTVVTEADGTVHSFDLDFALVGSDADIERVAKIAGKVADYVSFEVVDGNAVVNVGVPAGMRAKIVDYLAQGDVEAAQDKFNQLSVLNALSFVAKVEPSDISAANATEIQAIIDMVAKVDTVVNKVLGKVESSVVYDVNGNACDLLSGNEFVVNDNSVSGLVSAIASQLSEDLLLNKTIADFMNVDGVYTVKCDVALSIGGIKETVIVNLDIFGDYEKKNVIEDTVKYADGILTDLGVANAVTVTYDKDDCRALATLDARELVTNFTLDPTAFDGLYTDIKGYFDDNYGTSTIVVDGNEIVKAGKINKSALKTLIFSAATGFFQDAANLGANNVLRSMDTVVTEADGTVHSFDLDFALVGSDADIERVAKIAGKVADYVSFEVVDGNAVVNVGVPAGMRAKIVDYLAQGDVEAAQDKFNQLSVLNALSFVAKVEPSDISAANATEIQAIIDMVAKVDTVVNKVLGKVESSVVYDVNGNACDLLSGNEFVVNDNSVSGLVSAIASQLSEDLLLNKTIADFMNVDGVYTVKCDVALSIGGIKETVIVNLDVFGDYEKKNAIEDTVNYAESIFAKLGVASFASVELKDGKAVATFDASALLADGLDSFNEAALDGLYTDVKDYFYANFGDSTIKVGNFELVTAGKINKAAVKDVIFDFATGFFTNVANMDANTIKSYNTVVVDGEGNKEEFAFDFNLGGKEAHIEKLQTIAAKVAELVSFSEVNGNAAVTVSLPAGMKNKVAEYTTQESFNQLSVVNALGLVAKVDPSDVSVTYAKDIQTAIDMVAKMDSVINKVISKVENGVAYDVNGNAYALLSGEKFDITENSIAGLVSAFATQLSYELLTETTMADFMNTDGSYTITCDVVVKGIKETVTLTVDLF